VRWNRCVVLSIRLFSLFLSAFSYNHLLQPLYCASCHTCHSLLLSINTLRFVHWFYCIKRSVISPVFPIAPALGTHDPALYALQHPLRPCHRVVRIYNTFGIQRWGQRLVLFEASSLSVSRIISTSPSLSPYLSFPSIVLFCVACHLFFFISYILNSPRILLYFQLYPFWRTPKCSSGTQ
jgi:hypothetical protein